MSNNPNSSRTLNFQSITELVAIARGNQLSNSSNANPSTVAMSQLTLEEAGDNHIRITTSNNSNDKGNQHHRTQPVGYISNGNNSHENVSLSLILSNINIAKQIIFQADQGSYGDSSTGVFCCAQMPANQSACPSGACCLKPGSTDGCQGTSHCVST